MDIFYSKENTCVYCKKELGHHNFHLDHITPLACGGTNEENNLQILCRSCHLDKTRQEQEEGYIKINATESSYNGLTKNIINSQLSKTFAFVENVRMTIPNNYNKKYIILT